MKKKVQTKKDNYPKFTYEKEDDVLMIELNNKMIDYAEQSGNMIVHFSPSREAVLIEILNATKYLEEESKALPKDLKKAIFA